VALTVALVGWVLARTGLAEVGSTLRRADPEWIGVALALVPLGFGCSVGRWQLLLAAAGHRLGFATLLRAFLIGIFFNNFLPSTIGGDALRARESWHAGVPAGTAVAVVLVDRFLGLVALLLFAAAALAHGGPLDVAAVRLTVVAATVAGLAATWWLFGRHSGLAERLEGGAARVPRRLAELLRRAAGTVRLYRGRRGVLAAALALSAGLQAAVVLNAWALLHAIGTPLPLVDLLLVVPIAVVVTSLPLTVNGIGLRENLWAALLARYGFAPAAGVALAWLDSGLVLLQALVGAALFVSAGRRRAAAARPSPQPAPAEALSS
jgi:uncharacterized protein (TIRG00374 family)